VKAHASEKGRTIVFRGSPGEVLPDALVKALEDEAVACGWMRASGVLEDVELRAFRADLAELGASRRIEGSVHVVALEGSVGLASGSPSVGLRAVVARETDRGLETLAGEIVSARIVALEAIVTALDDVALPRAFDARAGVWLLGESGAPVQAPARAPAAAAPKVDSAWGAAIAASDTSEQRRAAPAAPAPLIPPRPVRASHDDEETVFPEAGDVVDHFAFGRCDVLKSDGDRLHLKVHKDGRIKEIALEMLKVTTLPDEDGKRRFKLERRM
jgi:predicted DNA-binding protein with PD1-like motif